MTRSHKRKDGYRSVIRRSTCGFKFKPETFYTAEMKDIERGYPEFAKKYGWPDFKNDEVRL